MAYFHGVVGDLETVDRSCRALANASHRVVASVNYPLSPEAKFPRPGRGLLRGHALAQRARQRYREGRGRMAVAGDSAGGDLAAAVALMARDRGGPALAYQFPIYPVTAPARVGQFASYRDNADDYLPTRGIMEWFWRHYLPLSEDGKIDRGRELTVEMGEELREQLTS